ncbi:DUF1501 domain-containing protein [Hamadaea tsunoensis]|uniref:DUF1501 domain-containing protein n=1 Tax=Hamadaea tsunoensis TaxID=53368 RepID=UPI0004174BEF|nr:DUF1501 domain-containing protein [Hamadaea tsunoensis]
MDTVTRRRFLLASGIVGATAIAGGAAAYAWKDIFATAGQAQAGQRTLVLVTLYGGNDGLANVIPFGDGAYHDARGSLAYTGDQVLRLDGATGLNPALKGLKALYDGKKLAVLRGVGYPKPDRSHFRSMDIWQTADPVRPRNTGWLGRWLDTAGGDPRLGISLEPVLPPLLAGERSAGAAVPLTGVAVPKAITPAVLSGFAKPAPGESPFQARAAACFADLTSVDNMITEVREADDDDQGDEPATATGGSAASLKAQLAMVAQCIGAKVATRVFSVSQGGFDFHAGEKASQEVVLKLVDTAVADFLKKAGDDVVVMIYSEFGRRVRANASDGTDHGTASNIFLAGTPVRGGRLVGDQPSLSDLDDGDLKYHTDFRDVYAAVLADVLNTDPGAVLPGWTGRMDGLFA